MKRSPNTLGPLLGFHGCDREVGEAVLAGETSLQPSKNEYDWLGSGIYFWVDSSERGLDWVREQSARQAKQSGTRMNEPFVIGAFVYPGLCLNLTDYGIGPQLVSAYSVLAETFEKAGTPLPKNTRRSSGVYLKRNLDCAVVNMVHSLRKEAAEEPYQTVYGVFEEGGQLYRNAGFRKKTHVQIAVIDTVCIIGYFRVNT